MRVSTRLKKPVEAAEGRLPLWIGLTCFFKRVETSMFQRVQTSWFQCVFHDFLETQLNHAFIHSFWGGVGMPDRNHAG